MARQVSVFCASSEKIDPKYNAAARVLVRALHALGWTFITGGGACGTMGAIAREADAIGATHVGVLPRFMKGREYDRLTDVVWTDTMSQRKERMREGSDAAIALPGGIGTMDELFETYTLRKLGRFKGPVFLLNLDGFFDPVITLLDHFVATGMLEAEDRALVWFPSTVEELVSYLK